VPPPPPETLVATVVLAGGDVGGVVLTPMKRVSVSGRIRFDGPPPASNTIVTLNLSPRSPEAAIGLLQPGPSTVREDRSLQFTSPAAEVLVRASISSLSWAVKSIRVGGVDITDIRWICAGRDVDDLEVEFTSRPSEVSGFVVDARGAPQMVPVLVFPLDRERWIFDSPHLRRTAGSRWTLQHSRAPPGRCSRWSLTPRSSPRRSRIPTRSSFRARATPFTLSEGERKTLDLHLPAAP
jgi:hypothetical protein